MFRSFPSSLSHLLLAPECLGCRNRLPPDRLSFCWSCSRWLLKATPSKEALMEHSGPGKELVRALREKAPQRAANWALELLERKSFLHSWRSLGVEIVVHAPQAGADNKSGLAILAQSLAARIGANFIEQAFRKRRLRGQHGRTLRERMDTDCFVEWVRPKDWIRGRQALVVDDVYTSGTTLDLCAYILRKAGASKVRQFALAKQMMHGFEGKNEDPKEEGNKIDPFLFHLPM